MTGLTGLDHALERTADFLKRYVVFASPEQADAAALWAGHTYVYDQLDSTPYLAIQSPSKQSGKTRLLECLALVARKPTPMAGASLAALFRPIDAEHPTILLDEADAIFNKKGADGTEDIRGLLNSGYRRGVPYYRVVGEGKKMRVEQFDTFCPKAVASIRALPDTVQDRCVVLNLKRRSRSEPIGRFRYRTAEQEAQPIRDWWESLAEQLVLPDAAEVPDELPDRAADSWEPLLALADEAGGAWLTRARRAAIVLSGNPEVEDDTLGTRLLAAIRGVFADRGLDRMATAALIEALRADEEQPWADYSHGRGLRAEGLAFLLRPYGIRAHQMKVVGNKVRGFDLDQFTDAFSRYLPPPGETPLTRYSGA